jgi:hypothetical protein
MRTKFKTIKQYAHALLIRAVATDQDGRRVGLCYLEILQRIRKRFPVVTYKGPHTGHPPRITVEELRQIAWAMQRDNSALRLPVRPRHRKTKRKKKVKS